MAPRRRKRPSTGKAKPRNPLARHLRRRGHAVLDSWIFSGTDNPVRDVMVGGEWVVRGGRHPREEAVARAYARAVRGLAASG